MRQQKAFYSILAAVLVVLPSSDAVSQTGASQPDAAATPRIDGGRPNLSGTWDYGSSSVFRARQAGASICIVACEEIPDPEPATGGAWRQPDRPSYKPEFAAKVHDLNARQVEEDPILRCENPGLPRIGPPHKIVHVPGDVVFLYDDQNGNFFRIIPTDGRDHRADAEPSFLGDAVAHWDGDTLVIESVNFNDKAWLTDDGSFHTTGLRVVERVSREGDTLTWQATAHDPAVLTEPWAMRPRTATIADVELVEAPPCDERDLAIVVDPTTSHDNAR